MGATIKDIAKKLNISAAAVSKALNNKSGVSDKLRKEIKDTAKAMGYSTNYIARSLVTNETRTIGVFILSRGKELVDSSHFIMFDGMIEEANKNEYDIVLFTTNSDLEFRKSYIQLCKERRVEGAIFIGLRLDDPHIEEIQNTEIPIVIIDTYLEGNPSLITTDNEAGVNMALKYLWDLGHEKVAYINGLEEAQVSQIRYNGYKNFYIEKEIFNSELVFSGDFTKESGYRCAVKIMNLKDRPSAIFAASDLMALGAIEAIADMGLRVPEDISVVGFDDIIASRYSVPKLTTVGQNFFLMGGNAVNLVLKREKSQKIVLNPEFLIRKSCRAIK